MSEVPLLDLLESADAGFWGAGSGTSDVDVRVIRNGDVLASGTVRWDELPLRGFTTREAAKAELQRGDIVITTSGYCGQVAYVDRKLDAPLCTTNFVRAIRPKRSVVEPRYLFWLLNSKRFQVMISPFVRGTAMKNLSFAKAAAQVRLPLPPMEDQRRIAAVLDKADELRARRHGSLALLDSLTEPIFMEIFGDPAVGAHPFAERPLAQIVADGTTVTYGIVQAGEEYHGGVPYIRTGDIVDGHIATSQLRHTDPALAARFSRSTVRAGDLVMSIRATVGTTAMVPPELEGANLTQGTARIAPGADIEPLYLLAFLRTVATQRWIERQVKGATFREITLNRLRELPVMVPPMKLQAQFAAAAKQRLAVESTATASAAHLESLFTSLQHRAFSGQL